MAKSQKRWDVVYEQVNLETRKTVQKFAAQNVDWKTALMVKRNHKRIVSMKAAQQKREPDVCWRCGKSWSEHRTNRVGHEVCP